LVSVAIAIQGGNGDKISLEPTSDFVLTSGVSGFGIPPTEVRIDQSAADGGVWRRTRRGIRVLDLPIVIFGTDRTDVEDKLRRLARLLQDVNGPTSVIAEYDSGESWALAGHYVGGAETQFGSDANNYFCRWVITLNCPEPYWIRSESESYTVNAGVTGRSIIPDLAELRLTSGQALGVLSVENAGDVPAYPTWVIKGPADSVVITNADGIGFTYTEAIALGVTITIDAFAGTVKNQLGANLYSALSTSPKMFSIPTGTSTVSINAINATSATSIQLFFQPRKEVVH
jgi:phage-related protein